MAKSKRSTPPPITPRFCARTSPSVSTVRTAGPTPTRSSIFFYGCGSSLNWDGYCNPEVDKLIEPQSIEADPGRRKQLVWEIERKLAEDDSQPVIFYGRVAQCWQPQVKGFTIMVNSMFNGWRMEDVWLDN